MTRPVWIQFDGTTAMQSAGVAVQDLLTGNLDQLQISERTIVAIKADYALAVNSTSATPDTFEVSFGFIVGSDNLIAADMPAFQTNGLVNPGWMWRKMLRGITSGDGTNAIQVANIYGEIDVRSKRKLSGLGAQTLFLVTDVEGGVSGGDITVQGQVLLAQKG